MGYSLSKAYAALSSSDKKRIKLQHPDISKYKAPKAKKKPKNNLTHKKKQKLHLFIPEASRPAIRLNAGQLGVVRERVASQPTKGEAKVIEFLNSERLVFLREYPVIHKFKGKYQLLIFDFYLPYFNLFIEYQGAHHYMPVYGEGKFEKQKLYDRLKHYYCLTNKIHLLCIPCMETKDIPNIICKKVDEIAPI